MGNFDSDTVVYDYEGMAACLADVTKCIESVQATIDDVNQIIASLHEVFKTQQVADAQSAVYRQTLQHIVTEVLEPLHHQRSYVEQCMDEARAGDSSLAGGWG